MKHPTRNRIKTHRRVRAGDLLPHELNFRLHPEGQKTALRDLYEEVGFARSLLAYELPDGRLKLIDGHLRRDLDPDLEVDVEVLDVSDAEARTLLLSMDPLAGLAETHAETHARLRALTQTNSAALDALWRASAAAGKAAKALLERPATEAVREKFLIVVECDDEAQQTELLDRFLQEGLTCKALVS